MKRLSVLALAYVLMAGAGCSSSAWPLTPSQTPTPAPTPDPYARCRAIVGDAFDALSGIDSRLDVGITLMDYSTKVGDAKALMDQIDQVALQASSSSCQTIYLALVGALGQYTQAGTAWANSIKYPNLCREGEVSCDKQPFWTQAATFIKVAKTDLDQLRHPASAPGSPALSSGT